MRRIGGIARDHVIGVASSTSRGVVGWSDWTDQQGQRHVKSTRGDGDLGLSYVV